MLLCNASVPLVVSLKTTVHNTKCYTRCYLQQQPPDYRHTDKLWFFAICSKLAQTCSKQQLNHFSHERTDIRTQTTCHPHGRVFLMCYSQSYEGTFGTTNFSYVWKILVNGHFPDRHILCVFSVNHQNKKSSGSPEFFKKHSLPCAPWCILRPDGAYCAFLVHKYPIYPCSGV